MQIIVTEPIHAEPLARLRAIADVVTWQDDGCDDWSRADGVIVRTSRVSREKIYSAPRLRVIGKHGGGVNAIDLSAARERGIEVVYAPEGNVNSVAELVVALTLAVARRIHENRNVLLAEGTNESLTGIELSGKTMGLVGVGRIARRAGEIFRNGFGMELHGYSPHLSDLQAEALCMTRHETLASLIMASDVISISVPLTPQTRHLVGRAELALCKPGAILVNTARGGVVDEAELAFALRSGRLAGAACDVFEQEPPSADHRLIVLPNFVGTAHVGAATEEAMLRVGNCVVDDVLAVMEGREPSFPYRS